MLVLLIAICSLSSCVVLRLEQKCSGNELFDLRCHWIMYSSYSYFYPCGREYGGKLSLAVMRSTLHQFTAPRVVETWHVTNTVILRATTVDLGCQGMKP